jgi:hypothetical protein
MTLGEIRSEIARVVDNGVPSTDARVIQRVNQAQRRLHAIRAWVGAVAKYKVDVISGVFTLPSQLESIVRVAKNNNTTLASGNVLLCDNAYVFIHDDGDLVPLNFVPIGSTANVIQFKIDSSVSPVPTSVVVTGKKKMVEVQNDSDELIIADLEALKLMVLALWREENNQVDMATSLQAKAVEHMAYKTDMSVEEARRLVYQSKLSTHPVGTMGYVRAKLGLDLEFGIKLEDAKLFDLVNKAQDLLITKKRLLLSALRYGVKDGLTLPTYSYIVSDTAVLSVSNYQIVKLAVLALTALSLSSKNAQLNLEQASKFEAEAIKMLEEELNVELESKRHGTYTAALSTAIPGTLGYMKARFALEAPNGLRLSDSELTRFINQSEEQCMRMGTFVGTIKSYTLTIDQSDGLVYVPNDVEAILGATFNGSPIPVYDEFYDFKENGPGYQQVDIDSNNTSNLTASPCMVARGETRIDNVQYRAYFVRGNWASSSYVRLLVKKRPVYKTQDSDVMSIKNYPAIFNMALAALTITSNAEQSAMHEQKALLLLRDELRESKTGEQHSIRIQAQNFALGGVIPMI